MIAALRGLLWIVRRSLRQHALSTLVTAGSVALASGLVMAVYAIQAQAVRAFTGGPVGFDAVLGARGSQLQLVLNAIFHLETSPGNLPWSTYEEVRLRPGVTLAIPYAVGDNFRGFRIVGTTGEIFTAFEYEKGKPYRFAQGRPFDPQRFEAVLGDTVARRTGLSYGAEFHPAHNIDEGTGHEHHEHYVVSGVLAPTNTPADRVIWIPIEGVYRMEGHVLRGGGIEYTAKEGEAIPDEHKEVSAVLLKLARPDVAMVLNQQVNRDGKEATLAWPIGMVMADLFDKIGWVNRVLELVAILVVLVAAAGILASLYNTMQERRREFAILRALGARRRTVFAAVVGEAAAIGALGALLGYLVYGAILLGAAAVIRAQVGVVLDVWQWHPALAFTPPGIVALAACAGCVPAWRAYATDVATGLAPAA